MSQLREQFRKFERTISSVSRHLVRKMRHRWGNDTALERDWKKTEPEPSEPMQESLDDVEEASMESFPASDPPATRRRIHDEQTARSGGKS
jgi:hypothetical protein